MPRQGMPYFMAIEVHSAKYPFMESPNVTIPNPKSEEADAGILTGVPSLEPEDDLSLEDDHVSISARSRIRLVDYVVAPHFARQT